MGLRSRLPEIAAALGPAVRAGITDGAELVAASAKERVPVVTGRLQRAIHTQEEPEGTYVIAGDSQAFYGNMVEHGGAVNRPPHPFLIPALEENRQAIEQQVAKAIREASG